MDGTLPETNSLPLKMDGKLLSFWDGLFSGAMLVSGRVDDKGMSLWDQKQRLLSNLIQLITRICF